MKLTKQAKLAGLKLLRKGLGFIRPDQTPTEETYPITDFHAPHYLRFTKESDLTKRFYPLPSSVNMRDLGGYTGLDGRKTKWGKLIRSEELSHLSPTDQKILDTYGITHIYDFRDYPKTLKSPDYLPPGATYENIEILKGAHRDHRSIDYHKPGSVKNFLGGLYKFIVQERAQMYAKPLKVIADNKDAVVLFHCTNGKDRTGFLAALLLLIAGVDEETILSDYSLSNLTMDEAFKILGTIFQEDLSSEEKKQIPLAALRDFFGVDPDWLKYQLDYIQENYGDVDHYLMSETDLTQEDLNHIRENILEGK